jgi:hypothetical protein
MEKKSAFLPLFFAKVVYPISEISNYTIFNTTGFPSRQTPEFSRMLLQKRQ